MKYRRHLLFALAVVFAILVVWQVLSANRTNDSKARVMIPNVGMMYFERAEYGTNFIYGTSTERFLVRVLGEKWARKLGYGKFMVSRSRDALWVWLLVDCPQKALPSNLQFRLADEQGYYAHRLYGGHVEEYDSGTTLIGVEFRTLPRQSRRLQLALFAPDDRWDYKKRAEIAFANPTPPMTPASMPVTPLPLTVTATNGLEISLLRLAMGVGHRREFMPAKADDEVKALAAIQIREGGVFTKDWRPVDVRITDRFGQSTKSGAHGNSRRDLTNYYHFSTGLWPDTNGMQFAFEFAREKTATFTTNELLVLRGIAVPGFSNVTQLHFTTNILGHDLKVIGLFGDRGKITNYNRMDSSGMSLEIQVDPPILDKRLSLIRVVDDQGRQGQAGGKSWSRDSGKYGVGVKAHNKAKTVDLTLAVHPSVFVEFAIAPEALKPVTE